MKKKGYQIYGMVVTNWEEVMIEASKRSVTEAEVIKSLTLSEVKGRKAEVLFTALEMGASFEKIVIVLLCKILEIK